MQKRSALLTGSIVQFGELNDIGDDVGIWKSAPDYSIEFERLIFSPEISHPDFIKRTLIEYMSFGIGKVGQESGFGFIGIISGCSARSEKNLDTETIHTPLLLVILNVPLEKGFKPRILEYI